MRFLVSSAFKTGELNCVLRFLATALTPICLQGSDSSAHHQCFVTLRLSQSVSSLILRQRRLRP